MWVHEPNTKARCGFSPSRRPQPALPARTDSGMTCKLIASGHDRTASRGRRQRIVSASRGAIDMTDKVAIKTVAELKTWVGKEVAVGKWITVTQDLINKFAEASGDFQWIHVDVE